MLCLTFSASDKIFLPLKSNCWENWQDFSWCCIYSVVKKGKERERKKVLKTHLKEDQIIFGDQGGNRIKYF